MSAEQHSKETKTREDGLHRTKVTKDGETKLSNLSVVQGFTDLLFVLRLNCVCTAHPAKEKTIRNSCI